MVRMSKCQVVQRGSRFRLDIKLDSKLDGKLGI